MRNTKILTLALLCALAEPGYAGTAINGNAAINPDGRLEVHNVRGRVQIRTWDKNQVDVHGTLGEGSQFDISGAGADVVVRIKNSDKGSWSWWGNSGPREDTLLEIMVPKGISPEVHSVSADVDIAGLDGSRTVNVETVSGDVLLNGRLKGQVHGETVSGQLSIDSSGEALRRLSTSTVSGDTTIHAALSDGGEIKSDTVSGDLRLRLPKSLNARVSAESFSGELRAPGAKIQKEEFGPGSSFEQRYGSGSGEIQLESFSGDTTLDLE